MHILVQNIQSVPPSLLQPGGFARVPSPKMMSDCHMLRMNVCAAGRQARRHAETRKRVDLSMEYGQQ